MPRSPQLWLAPARAVGENRCRAQRVPEPRRSLTTRFRRPRCAFAGPSSRCSRSSPPARAGPACNRFTKATCASSIATASTWRSTPRPRIARRAGASGSTCTPTASRAIASSMRDGAMHSFANGDIASSDARHRRRQEGRGAPVLFGGTCTHERSRAAAADRHALVRRRGQCTHPASRRPLNKWQCRRRARGQMQRRLPREPVAIASALALPTRANPDPACKICDSDYKRCMKRCFQ